MALAIGKTTPNILATNVVNLYIPFTPTWAERPGALHMQTVSKIHVIVIAAIAKRSLPVGRQTNSGYVQYEYF
ncbi:hypothetical protein KZP23_14900 [Echinicola marina]|uniref:hypothetical protein n=1 Tax=Echinicola marina TaxID=2859768 RepID=UPI001CF65F84|nr:hypothetical protein [Echinicola marina]UCS92006.1 hypothetical protein KZP23_14900 [Echinicola marina]